MEASATMRSSATSACAAALAGALFACGASGSSTTAATAPAPTANPASAITSTCVAHAGSGHEDSSHHETCEYDAECVAHPGQATPGDGFVGISCDETGCVCSVRLAAAEQDTKLPRFEVKSPCGAVRELLFERCVGKPEPPPPP